MSKAEAQISAKLRQSFENDLQSMAVSVYIYTIYIYPFNNNLDG